MNPTDYRDRRRFLDGVERLRDQDRGDPDVTILAAILVGAEDPSLGRLIRTSWPAEDQVGIRDRAANIRAMMRLFGRGTE